MFEFDRPRFPCFIRTQYHLLPKELTTDAEQPARLLLASVWIDALPEEMLSAG
jgi:hypothetical protein